MKVDIRDVAEFLAIVGVKYPDYFNFPDNKYDAALMWESLLKFYFETLKEPKDECKNKQTTQDA